MTPGETTLKNMHGDATTRQHRANRNSRCVLKGDVATTRALPTYFPCYQRFHVLFHFLFKVLFIFPSRYFFAIGLSQVFSSGWALPPDLCCSPKQHDSTKTLRDATTVGQWTGMGPSVSRCLNDELCPTRGRRRFCRLQFASTELEITTLSCSRFARRY